MRTRQALALAFLAALIGCAAATGASSAVPACKAGQKSTKAKPCAIVKSAVTKTKTAAPTPVADLAQPDLADTQGRVGATDAVTIIRFLDPVRGLYQIEVQNTSGIGYINTFNWVPPPDMTITAVTSTEGGHCSLVNAAISCTGGGKGVAPPTCTCLAGGSMTINFTATGNAPVYANGYWTYYGVIGGYTQITSMTPVPYHIPSFVASSAEDIPICKAGQTSTTANPCTKSG
ncbi:MAG TPA: hypothetical protein VG652_04815 [Gaiellaceae bacterium]|nr:hypothetical protein [Gaiellaceae bacterium]